MSGLIITIDVEGLVRQQWKKLPLRKRLLVLLIPGVSRKNIEAEAIRRMTTQGDSNG